MHCSVRKSLIIESMPSSVSNTVGLHSIKLAVPAHQHSPVAAALNSTILTSAAVNVLKFC